MFSWFITMFSWFITIYFMPRVESYVKVAAKNTWDSRKSKSVLQNLIKLKWIYILRAKVHYSMSSVSGWRENKEICAANLRGKREISILLIVEQFFDSDMLIWMSGFLSRDIPTISHSFWGEWNAGFYAHGKETSIGMLGIKSRRERRV